MPVPQAKPKFFGIARDCPAARNSETRDRELRLSAHRNVDRLAPLADAGIADAVNAAICPFGRGSRERGGVGVVGCGVVGKQDFALAVAAVDDELDQAAKRFGISS